MKKNILFISHNASLTGAPVVLLHLLRWLKKHTGLTPTVLLLEGGVLQSEFEDLAQTFVWIPEKPHSLWKNRIQRLAGSVSRHQRQVTSQLKKIAPQLIYANTVVTSGVAVTLAHELRCPSICHIHELQIVIQEVFGASKFAQLSKNIDCFIAASEAVASNLKSEYAIPAEKVKTVHEFVPVLERNVSQKNTASIRSELGIPEDAFLVAASGTIEWRKGSDLFIQIAQQVNQESGKMPYFIWIGGNPNSIDGVRMQYDLTRSGIDNNMRFLGAKKNVQDYLKDADVFVLTSREDPYPLVCLEAAALGKPVICFADSGGMPEFVEQDCGIIVPYLRTDLMAKAITQLRDNEQQRLQLGNNAFAKMQAQHTVDIAASQIASLIESRL